MAYRTPYSAPQPFSNLTNYTVGHQIVRDGKGWVVTAIKFLANNRFGIYCIEAGTPMKLVEFVDLQRRREAGQVNVYCPGKKIFDIVISYEQ